MGLAHKVGLASFPGDPSKVLTNGFNENAMGIAGDAIHTVQAALFEFAKEGSPTCL